MNADEVRERLEPALLSYDDTISFEHTSRAFLKLNFSEQADLRDLLCKRKEEWLLLVLEEDFSRNPRLHAVSFDAEESISGQPMAMRFVGLRWGATCEGSPWTEEDEWDWTDKDVRGSRKALERAFKSLTEKQCLGFIRTLVQVPSFERDSLEPRIRTMLPEWAAQRQAARLDSTWTSPSRSTMKTRF